LGRSTTFDPTGYLRKVRIQEKRDAHVKWKKETFMDTVQNSV